WASVNNKEHLVCFIVPTHRHPLWNTSHGSKGFLAHTCGCNDLEGTSPTPTLSGSAEHCHDRVNHFLVPSFHSKQPRSSQHLCQLAIVHRRRTQHILKTSVEGL